MLKLISYMKDMNFTALMDIYSESNHLKADSMCSNLSTNEALFLVENQFYQYLRNDFFPMEGAFYAIWEEQNKWVSALRIEPYRNGLLLAGLETHPDHRNRGFAKQLVCNVLSELKSGMKVYSHVHKNNGASICVHEACGFQKIEDYAVYIDGSVDRASVTLMFTCRQGKRC